MKLAEQLKYYRKLAGLTQIQLAEILDIKQYNLTKYETGVATPPTDLLPLIAEALGVSLDALFGRKSPEKVVTKLKRSKREGKILETFKDLTAVQQRVILQQAEGLVLRKKKK